MRIQLQAPDKVLREWKVLEESCKKTAVLQENSAGLLQDSYAFFYIDVHSQSTILCMEMFKLLYNMLCNLNVYWCRWLSQMWVCSDRRVGCVAPPRGSSCSVMVQLLPTSWTWLRWMLLPTATLWTRETSSYTTRGVSVVSAKCQGHVTNHLSCLGSRD